MAHVHRALKLTPLLLLTACVSVPSAKPSVVKPQPDTSLPQTATFDPRHVRAHLDAELTAQTNANPAEVWTQLRNSFVMPDCAADPSIEKWAHRFTHNGRLFESRLREALPKIVYIHQVAAQYGVPGEFVLLPWVESRYRTAPGKRGGSAGIWQIMPSTAKAMGLRVNDRYDGRLNLQASSHAVLRLLNRYHQRFDDWRMASYAYNAGEFATARFLNNQNTRQAHSTIPNWAGHDATQRHLSQLLALACVIRDPGRFGVSLPTLPRDQRLTAVPIVETLTIAAAAHRAGMSVATLKQFNAAFLDGVIDGSAGADLLMPARHARQFRAAAENQTAATEVGDDPHRGGYLQVGPEQ